MSVSSGRQDELLGLSKQYAALPADKRAVFRLRAAEKGLPIDRLPIVALSPRPARAPLSHAQERLWFLWRLEPSSSAYNVSRAVRMVGALCADAVRRVFEQLAARHESLRSRFGEENGVPYQTGLAVPASGAREVVFAWRFEDISGDETIANDAEPQHAQLQERLGDQAREPFDLERGPVMRVVLTRIAADVHVLQFTAHHIVTDAWSMDLLGREFAQLYEAGVRGADATAEALSLSRLPRLHYADFAQWQRDWAGDRRADAELDFWRGRLGGERSLLALPLDRPRTVERSMEGARCVVAVPRETADALLRTARTNGVSPFAALLAVYCVLLARYSGQHDFCVGVPVSGRERAETHGLVGFFVNTLVIRAELSMSMSIGELFAHVGERVAEAQAHQAVPFARVVEAVQPQRERSHSPLFQTMFNYEVAGRTEDTELAGLTIRAEAASTRTARFDLVLNVLDDSDGLRLTFNYAVDLFDASTIERVSGHYVELLEQMCASGERRLCELSMGAGAGAASAAQRASYAYVPTVARFESRAQMCGDTPAVICGDERLSYAQLDAWADRLGVALMRAGVAHEDRVGVCLERSAGLAAALLGIWKAGAAQVPLDPSYPAARLRDMIGDAGVRCVIVDATSAAQLSAVLEGCVQVRIGEVGPVDEPVEGQAGEDGNEHADRQTGDQAGAHANEHAGEQAGDQADEQANEQVNVQVNGQPDGQFGRQFDEAATATATATATAAAGGSARPDTSRALRALRKRTASLHPEQLAYVIYTSGSTGRPKGVAVSQRSLSLHLEDFIGTYGISSQDTLLQSSTINFDVALHELLPALLMGGQVCMRGAAAWDLQALSSALATHQVTFARIPTALWQQWLGEAPSREALPSLRQITVGGEGLPGDALARWQRSALAGVRLDNLYGPTETTVAALYRRTEAQDTQHVSAPIGIAYPGRSVCVLDGDGNEVPVGGLGELCIGGVSLARGYLGRPGLTAERFVPSPYNDGERLYRSGDLCRLRADGCIEYLGRLDQQVKLRGYRIELGEIEVQLRGCAGVEQAVVALRGEGERRRLVAYWVGEAQAPQLQATLQSKLPGYMVPGGWMKLARLPVMANGKLDRGALPAPQEDDAWQAVAPRTARETQMRAIWASVLGREAQQLGVTQNFFEAGGDSIVSLQLIAKARQAGLKLTPKQVFDHPTIEAQARVAVELGGGEQVEQVEQAELHEAVPLTPIQRSFFERFEAAPSHWNQAVLLRVRGGLEVAVLERALQALVARHDALRLRFVRVGEASTRNWTQRVAPVQTRQQDPLVEQITIGDSGDWEQALHDACTRVQQQLDLQRGPLLKAAYLDVGRHGQRVLLAIHHLAVDGVSWRILLEELQQAYAQAERGEAIALGVRSTPFSVWSMRQHAYGMQAERLAELGWWQQRLTDVVVWPAAETTPTDTVTNTSTNTATNAPTATHTIRLDPQTTSALLYDSAHGTGRPGLTPEVLLLAALTRTLAQRSAHPRVLVELEGHGREDILDDIDLTRTVGWFTTRYPVVLEADADASHTLHTVRTALGEVPQRGLHWGLLQARASQDETVREALAGLPQATVGFNYLGQFDASLPESARFAFADERGGDSVQAGLTDTQAKALQLDALVADGELQVSWRYRTNRLTQEEVETCATSFTQQLQNMIDAARTHEHLPNANDSTAHAASALFSTRYPASNDDESGIWAQRLNAESAIHAARTKRTAQDGVPLPAGMLALNSLRAPARLFCIHPGYGLVAEYCHLAQTLNGVATVYAIQSPMFSDSEWTAPSFEALAANYVERMRAVQPQGPYRMLGWSFGGRVAVAMAAYLESLGESADLVGLGDTASHFTLPSSTRGARSGVHTGQSAESDAPAAAAGGFDRALQLAMRVDAHHVDLIRAHTLPHIASPITMWRASQSEEGPERRLDWAHHTAGGYRETLVEASHSNILRQTVLHDDLRNWFESRR